MTAEWAGHGIQANAIGPGYMLTDMNQALVDNPAFDAWVKGRTPSRRWGKPEELIGTAIFLASEASGLRQRADHLCRWRDARRAVSNAPKERTHEGRRHPRSARL